MTNNKKKSSPQKMKKRKEPIWLWLGVAGIILAGVFAYFHYTPPASLEERPSAQTVQRGQELYAQNCAVCHGPTAGGENPNSPGGGIKPEGGQSAPALNGTGHAWHHPNVMLFNKIKYGSEDKTSAMQGFKDRLRDDEIASIMHYFKSMWSDDIKMQHAMGIHKHGGS